jgi:hypothetical protein
MPTKKYIEIDIKVLDTFDSMSDEEYHGYMYRTIAETRTLLLGNKRGDFQRSNSAKKKRQTKGGN